VTSRCLVESDTDFNYGWKCIPQLPTDDERWIIDPTFALPALGKAEDAAAGLAAIVASVASGELTASEAGELSKVVDTYARALRAGELEDRVAALESERK
jgi:hypothetical protein